LPNSSETSTLPRGARGYAVLLRRNANLRNVWLGQVVSQIGDWFNTVAVLGLLIQLTGNPGSASLVIVTQILPSAVMGLFVSGAIADRFDRKKLMIIADLARAFIALSFLFVKSPELTWMA
jgi:MFS family permease